MTEHNIEKVKKMTAKPLTAVASLTLATTLATAAVAGSEMEAALSAGAQRMTSNEIAEQLAGKTVTFENAISGSQTLVYYDGANGMILKPVGADERIDGFYAVDLADHVCTGVYGDEPLRLRCLNVVEIDGVIHKFELDGSLRGRIVEEAEGNTT